MGFLEDSAGHFELSDSRRLTKSEFTGFVKKLGQKDALIFVHGFRNSFEESAFRLAQIVWDIQYQGVPVLFAWPSAGAVASYADDYDMAEFSRDGFLELLRTLQQDAGVQRISIIAHSMGNRVVQGALANWKNSTVKKPIFQLVLAAPDVQRNIFIRDLPATIALAAGVTLYASENDYAFKNSKSLRDFPRAGDISPPAGPVLMKGLDTIDVSALGEEIFGIRRLLNFGANHTVFAEKLPLIDEIARLIKTGVRPPHERTPVLRIIAVPQEPKTYWRFPK
jgi:esterase/lipase superfamily enzyme